MHCWVHISCSSHVFFVPHVFIFLVVLIWGRFVSVRWHVTFTALTHMITHLTAIFCSVGLLISLWDHFRLVHMWFHQLLMNRNLHLLFCYFSLFPFVTIVFYKCMHHLIMRVRCVGVSSETKWPKANRLSLTASDLFLENGSDKKKTLIRKSKAE